MGCMYQVSGCWSKSGLEGEAKGSQVVTGGGVFISSSSRLLQACPPRVLPSPGRGLPLVHTPSDLIKGWGCWECGLDKSG